MPRLRRIIEETNPPRIIAVGDVVSRETLAAGITVHLRIIDHKTLRSPVHSQDFSETKTYRVRNPAGVVTMEAWDVIRQAIRESSDALIVVDGEEDLLALPAIIEAPLEALVLYGQPSEGLVVVMASPRVKKEVGLLLERLPREEV